jgi:hypothetical protein
MADPLSLAASLAGLCTLAEAVVRTTRQFVKAVRGSEKEIAKLISSTAQLYGILEQIRLLEDGIEEEFSTFRMVRAEDLFSCETTLRKLETLLRRSNPRTASGFLNTTKKKLEWPFKDKEITDLQKEIESHKATLSLALNANEMYDIIFILSNTERLQAYFIYLGMLSFLVFKRPPKLQALFFKSRPRTRHFVRRIDNQSTVSVAISSRSLSPPITSLWFSKNVALHAKRYQAEFEDGRGGKPHTERIQEHAQYVS